MIKKTFLIFSLILFSCFISSPVLAKTKANRTVLSEKTQAKGYTAKYNKKFKIGITPGSLDADKKQVNLTLNKVKKNNYSFKKKDDLISDLFVFDLKSKNEIKIKEGSPLWLSIKYDSKKKGKKIIKFYNGTTGLWQEIPSQRKKNKKIVQAAINLPYAVVGVFNEKSKKTKKKKEEKKSEEIDYQIGYASWYVYDGAASTTYPYGSVLKVINLDNNKSCQVTVLDYGPFIEGRVIDLPKSAFSEIADISQGVVKVKVIPISIAN